MISIEFIHSIGDKVRIVDVPDITGHVIAQTNSVDGKMYHIVWWHNGHRLDEWMSDWEIEGIS